VQVRIDVTQEVTVKSTQKAVLFAQVTHDRKTHRWPVAVFNTAKDAKQYAVFMYMAHQSGDAVLAAQLDPKTVLADDGAIVKGTKWNVVEVPYAPVPDVGIEDEVASEEPATV
jgi:hypothetical protein